MYFDGEAEPAAGAFCNGVLDNFARKVQWALPSNDQDQLNGALKNLKAGFRIPGTTSIVWLCLIILVFIFLALL